MRLKISDTLEKTIKMCKTKRHISAWSLLHPRVAIGRMPFLVSSPSLSYYLVSEMHFPFHAFELFFFPVTATTVQAARVHWLASVHNGLRTAFPKEHPTGHPYTRHTTPLDSRLQSAVA